jgi:hypothetical protein
MTRQNDREESISSGTRSRRRFLKTIGALGAVGLAGCGGDGDDGTPTETPTDTEGMETTTAPDTETPTPTDTETPTPTEEPQPIPDPPAELLSFDSEGGAISGGESTTVSGELLNPYLFPVRTVEVTLETPSDAWDVSSTDDTSFEEIDTQGSESVGWEVTAPEDADGSRTLTATVNYASSTDEATVTLETSVFVISGDVTSPVTDGLIGQFDAAQLDVDGAVSSWADVSGSGAVLSQSSEDAQPTLEPDASPTGEPAVSFEADAAQFLSTEEPITTEAGGVTIAVLFRIDDHTVPRQALAYNGHDDNQNGYGITVNQEAETDGTVRGLYGGESWFVAGTTITDDEWHVATMVIPDDGTDPGLFLDGEELSLSAQNAGATPNAPTEQFGIGQDESEQEDPPYLDGDVGEELVYERALPQGERLEVEAYLEGKWITGGE